MLFIILLLSGAIRRRKEKRKEGRKEGRGVETWKGESVGGIER
jgi:hypothetical protein